jgi:hypothetical protein
MSREISIWDESRQVIVASDELARIVVKDFIVPKNKIVRVKSGQEWDVKNLTNYGKIYVSGELRIFGEYVGGADSELILEEGGKIIVKR